MLSAFDNPSFDVSVLTRKSSKTSFPSYVKIYHISDDYPEDELIGAFTSQDAIVNMAPITAVATHKAIIDAAIKAKVSRIVLSEFGTNVPELQTTEPVPIYQGKIEIREYMKSRESSELTWTGLVVGAFLDWYVCPTDYVFVVQSMLHILYPRYLQDQGIQRSFRLGHDSHYHFTHPLEEFSAFSQLMLSFRLV